MIDLTSRQGDTPKLSKLEMNQDKGLDEVYCSWDSKGLYLLIIPKSGQLYHWLTKIKAKFFQRKKKKKKQPHGLIGPQTFYGKIVQLQLAFLHADFY